jgi:hypothetical protein
VLAQLGEHIEIEKALERHYQVGQPLGQDPINPIPLTIEPQPI